MEFRLCLTLTDVSKQILLLIKMIQKREILFFNMPVVVVVKTVGQSRLVDR